MKLLVSVIIPTWNRPRLLMRALTSALLQRGARYEIIVVDDGDGSGAAAAKALADGRIRTLATGADGNPRGQVPARNVGIRSAHGQLIAFLDDDDWWADTDCLAALTAALVADEGLAYGSGVMVLENEQGPTGETIPFVAHATPVSLRRDNTLLVSSLAFPRRYAEAFGPFDESLPHYWDWDWYLRLAAAGVPFLPAATKAACISARPGSVSSAAHEEQRRTELARLCAKHGLGTVPLKNHLSIAQAAMLP